jgi:hypothetical protein
LIRDASVSKYRPSQHPTWYCRRGNIILGPVSTKVLHHYLFDGTLAEEDAGRVGHDGEWVPVVDLRRMFEEDGFVRPAVTQQTRQSATPAIDRLANSATRVPPARSGPGWLGRQSGFIADLVDSCAGWVADVFIGVSGLLLKALRLRTVQVVLGCFVLAAAIWGVVLPNWPLKAEQELAVYQSLLDEMTSLVGTDPGTAQWDALATRLSRQIKETGPRIRSSATSLRPDFQNLMWAIDLFPKALAEARSGQTPEASVVAMVSRHLEQADRFIQRQQTLAQRNVAKEPQRIGRMAAIILTPTIAAGFLFWRRRMLRLRS